VTRSADFLTGDSLMSFSRRIRIRRYIITIEMIDGDYDSDREQEIFQVRLTH